MFSDFVAKVGNTHHWGPECAGYPLCSDAHMTAYPMTAGIACIKTAGAGYVLLLCHLVH